MAGAYTDAGLDRPEDRCDGCGDHPIFRAAVDGGVVSLCWECREAVAASLEGGDDDLYECPHDDCDQVFNTRRERRGHLGSSEHALDVPDGEFWCGYCGHGPTTWRGINAHHGSADHDGDPVRLDEDPDREELIAPGDVPDHKDPELLEELYRRHDGNYTEMCRQHDFEVSPGRVRHYLIEFGIHEVTPQGETTHGDGPPYRDREWLEERYYAADGNVSEMHRRIKEEGEVEVPYRTLLKNLKRLGIHDPTESPGRSQTSEQQDAEAADDGESDDQQSGDEPGVEPDPECHTEATPEPHSEATLEPHTEAHDPNDDVDDQSEQIDSVIDNDNPEDVDGFEDLSTPEWLAESSFHVALEMSDDPEEFAANLGWDEPEQLGLMVEALGLDAFGGEQA